MAEKKKKKRRISKSLENFLAAPEQLQKDKEERKKALQRKKLLEAEQKRKEHDLKFKKKKPSVEDVLGDIVRVATDEVTNPFWRMKACSPKRYKTYGHYPFRIIEEMFGQFAHAKQVAELEDQPGTRKKKAARSEASRREHAARYISRVILPYEKKPDKIRKPILMLSISDIHSTFLDPFTWWVFLSCVRDLKPDIVYFNGDVYEFTEISKYPQIPGWTIPLQLELDFAREMFKQLRGIGFQGDIYIGGGNHDIDRFAMYLTQVARPLANLRSLRFDKLLELDDLGVNLIFGGTIASPAHQEHDKRGTLLFGFYRVHHGTLLGPNPAIKELKDATRSGQSAHAHRAQLAYGTTEALKGLSWMTTPAACTERAARAYIKGTSTGWQKGFGLAWLYPDGDVHQYPVITNNDRATVEGYVYEAKRPLPDPDPQRLWIKDFRP